jgi:hypothetical protein
MLYGMRLLAWNIRQGGGSRLPRIADALARHEADILVLSEYRGGEAAGRLRAALALLGYRYATAATPPPGRSGVLVAARCAFRDDGAVGVGLPEPYRMVSAEFPDFRLVGVYMPNLIAKLPYWETLIAILGETDGTRSPSATSTPAVPISTRQAPLTEARNTWIGSPRSGFATCGAAAIRNFANIPGSAPGGTGSASTTPFCRMPWSRAPAQSATRTKSASPASPITRR